MITSWDIYWITRLDGINVALSVIIGWVIAASIIGGVGYYTWIFDSCLGDKERHWKRYKMLAVSLISLIMVLITLLLLTPTTKEAAAIYLVPKIANNEQVQKLPDNAMKLLNGKLEEWVSDFDEKKGESK
jgi:predicted membrane protein